MTVSRSALRPALAALMLLAVPVQAQDRVQSRANPTFIDLFGERLNYTHPDWTDGAPPDELLGAMKVSRQENERQFLIELIPADQTFEAWTDLFAVMAKREGSVGAELDEIEANFTGGCAPDQLLILRSDRMENPPPVEGGFATVICGAYSFDPTRGQVAAFRVVEKNGVTARLYREWRGPAFDAATRENAPVAMGDVAEVNRRLLAADFSR